MNISKLLFTLTVVLGILVLTAQATRAHYTPVHQPSSSPIPSSEQHHHLWVTYAAMIEKIACARQEIWQLLVNQFNFTNSTTAHEWFEYCFLKDIANPPSNNLTIKKRMSIEYQVIEELTIPLRDVLNYEAHINTGSETYRELVEVQRQINISLEEMQSMQNSDLFMEQLSLQSSEDSQSSNNASNSTQVQQGRCDGLVDNSVDEYRDLIELYIGLTFTLSDLVDIKHEL